jgi:pimeloyl-ACP methyl ester carboxylesterase
MSIEAEGKTDGFRVTPVTLRRLRATLTTVDGVRIEAAYAPRTGPAGGWGADPAGVPVIVLAHGFTGALDRPAVRRAVAAFTEHAAVVSFSFRGHGRSTGRSTVGDLEVHDLAAAVRWARRGLGHERVATVGFSMGGSVVLRHGALHRASHDDGAHADAVAAVSAAARWYYRGTGPMRRLHWAIQRPAGRLVTRLGLRTRVHAHDWEVIPLSPVEAVPRLTPTPLLIVHGDRDAYFPLDHPRSLAAAADPATTRLWIEHGFGHAENAAPPELLHRIGDWAVGAIGAGDEALAPGGR